MLRSICTPRQAVCACILKAVCVCSSSNCIPRATLRNCAHTGISKCILAGGLPITHHATPLALASCSLLPIKGSQTDNPSRLQNRNSTLRPPLPAHACSAWAIQAPGKRAYVPAHACSAWAIQAPGKRAYVPAHACSAWAIQALGKRAYVPALATQTRGPLACLIPCGPGPDSRGCRGSRAPCPCGLGPRRPFQVSASCEYQGLLLPALRNTLLACSKHTRKRRDAMGAMECAGVQLQARRQGT